MLKYSSRMSPIIKITLGSVQDRLWCYIFLMKKRDNTGSKIKMQNKRQE